MSEDPEYVCTECGSDLKRLISAGGGIIFKGSGFYNTDYKKIQDAQVEANKPRQDRSSAGYEIMEKWEKKVVKAEKNKKKE